MPLLLHLGPPPGWTFVGKDLALKQAIDQINTSHGKGFIMFLGQCASPLQRFAWDPLTPLAIVWHWCLPLTTVLRPRRAPATLLALLRGALRALGLNVEENGEIKRATVEGCGGVFPVGKEAYVYRKKL